MKKWVIIFTALLSGGMLLFGGCRHGQNKGEQLEFVFDYFEEVLDLDKAQAVKLAEIKKELMEKLTAFRESREKMHPIFKGQLASVRIDKAVIKQAVSEHRRQLDDAIDVAIDRLAEFHALLTPEQRQKLINKLEKMEKWHGCGEKQ
jgi:periplasmic protein CpxP/Spy